MTKAVSSDSGGLTVGGTAGTFLGEILVGVAAALETASHGTIRSDDLHFDIPPSPEMGDLAVGMFPFAKAAKKSPADFAAELAESLRLIGLLFHVACLMMLLRKPAMAVDHRLKTKSSFSNTSNQIRINLCIWGIFATRCSPCPRRA